MPQTRSKEISTPDRPSTAQTRELPPSERSGRAEADSDQALPVRIRSHKLVVDAERRTCHVLDFTIDDGRAMAADVTARVATLERRWEESGDLQALFGALVFYELQLPEWLFRGLMKNFEEQFKNPEATRFLTVRHAHDVLGMTIDEAYDWASENVTDLTAKGGRDTMMKSYQKIRPQVAKNNRIQPRPRTRSRRSSMK